MLYIFFLRILNEDTNSCLPSPPPLTPKTNPCDTSSTPGSITFNEDSTQIVLYPQYKINDNDWQDDTLFNNLTHNTLYKFTARYKSYEHCSESEEYEYRCGTGFGPDSKRKRRSTKRKQSITSIEIDPPVVKILEVNDTSIRLNSIQPYTTYVYLEYHEKDGNWQDSSTFTGLGNGPYYFTSRYQLIEIPLGPPTYIQTMQSKPTFKKIICTHDHSLRNSHISFSSLLLIFILYQSTSHPNK